ncbi:Clp protease N-terminal domain-containing protein [Actinoallomurus sp. NPDC052274]|uniref:Clp protease N-terminal domain-containing protein n=1 Tax=Actinoallomurus sp. NPDC052274 TaxID=3155420 RepID=UPI00343C8C2B
MMNASSTGTTDASREVVESLARAYEKAAQTGQTVGTQHLLFALLKGESAAADLLSRSNGGLRAGISAKDDTVWLSGDDDRNDPPAAPAVTALLHEAEWGARRTAKPRDKSASPESQPMLPSGALVTALGQMLVSAHELGVTWANETHMLMGLLHDPGNRASEALLERRLDRDELRARLAVHPSAHQDGEPNMRSVDGLCNLGMLDKPAGRGWGGRIGRLLTSGGFGSPVVPTVRMEAKRQTIRLGHSRVTTAHLLLAMLVVDDQLTTAGRRFRDGVAQVNTGAELLRTRGATSSAVFNAVADLIRPGDRPQAGSLALESSAEKALTRARLLAHERKSPSTGTTHLLAAVLADPDDPCHSLLSAIGVDVEELRQALG